MREKSLISRGLLLLFFLSGFSALVYEVVWARMLGLVFGTTVYAWATVLAAYMGGMGLGAVIGGRFADKYSRPLGLFALCEAGIGLFGAASPAILHGVQWIFLAMQPALAGSEALQIVGRIALCAGVLVIPTMLMGASLPLIGKSILSPNRPFGRDIGAIYSVNTFGACAGALATGFALLPLLGMFGSLVSAAGINWAVAVSAMLFFGNQRIDNKSTPAGAQSPAGQAAVFLLPQWLLPSILGISGFCAMAFEVLWGRALVFFLTSTTYAFTSMLSIVLLGLALGALAASRIGRKGGSPVAWIAALQVCIGLLGFASPWLLQHIDPFVQYVESHSARSWLQWIVVRYAVCFGMIFPAALCMGAAFPLAMGAAIRSLRTAGQSIGFLLALNTFGGIAGSLFAAIVLVPATGVQRSLVIVGLANCAAGWAVQAWGKGRSRRWTAAGAAMTAAVCFFSIVFIGNNPMVLYSRVIRGAQCPTHVLSYKEDRAASVAVLETGRGRALNIDGFNAAGTYGYEYMHLLGHLPVLLSPSPDTALVICLGTGTTCGTVGLYPIVKMVDCVEISTAVIASARLFSDVNNNLAENPKIHIIHDDGRNHLLRSPRLYDVITLEPMHPYLSSATNLYSSDFYRLCRTRLAAHGVMAQWAPLHVLSLTQYRMLIASFASVFPHTSLWFLGTEGILIGSLDSLRIDIAALKRTMSADGVGSDLAKISLAGPQRLLSCFLMGERQISEFVKDVPVISDDHPLIEFSAPRNLVRPANLMWLENMEELLGWRVPVLSFVSNADAAMTEGIRRCSEASSMIMKANIMNSRQQFFQALTAADSALTLMPGDTTGRMVRREAMDNAALLCLNGARGLRSQGLLLPSEAAYLRALAIDSSCVPAHTELATLYTTLGRSDKGLEHAQKAVIFSSGNPAMHTNLAVVYMNLNRPVEAEAELLRAIGIDEKYGRAHYFLGMLYGETGRREKSQAEQKRAEELGYSPRPQ